jgi:uncharacterized protein
VTTPLLSPLALAGIGLYQRHISPYKGFRCAYGAEGNTKSCSAFGRHVFGKYDVATATALLKRRFEACRGAYLRFKETAEARKAKWRARRKEALDTVGDCAGQGGCDACDVGSCAL